MTDLSGMFVRSIPQARCELHLDRLLSTYLVVRGGFQPGSRPAFLTSPPSFLVEYRGCSPKGWRVMSALSKLLRQDSSSRQVTYSDRPLM
jgi:hypothetical protein